MKAVRFVSRTMAALLVAAAPAFLPACATTKNVVNKATFGLVGGEDTDEAAASRAETKAQRKAEEQERERQQHAAKQARKQERAARKQAEKEAKQQGEEKSWLSKATFGLAGGESKAEQAAEKEAKQAAKAEKKAQERAKKERKQAAKEAKKEEHASAEAVEKSGEAPGEQKGWLSKASFGLLGDKKASEEAAGDQDKRAAKEDKKARERTEKEQKKAAKQERKAEERARKEAKQAGGKRPLMSKLTFGLVGGKKGDTPEPSTGPEAEAEAGPARPLMAMAPEDASAAYRSAAAMNDEERKLAKLPFRTTISYDSISASGKPEAVASRETYSKYGYGITDLGDVRIAVKGMTFSGGSRAGGVVIASEERGKAGGRSGVGNESFVYEYVKGVSACTFGTVQFTIAKGVLVVDDVSAPIGQGEKLIVLDENGKVRGVFAIAE